MDVFKTLILDTPTVEGATGTVTSVDLTAGTGISVSGGPITSSGSITVTNTSPDQTVALTGGTGISVTGTYPSFTVTNSSPSSGGDVVGPASATDNAVVRFDSTTGKLIQNSGVTISDADLLTTTDLTVNDDTVLGSSNTDTVTFNARSASEFTPATDNTYDLGRTGHEWRDLYIDGTANIDSLVADTADINGGTIDGTAIGATTPSTVAATTASASTSVTTPSVTNAGTLALSATGANVITASTNGAERMRITSAGRVGIGSTSPATALEISGTANESSTLSLTNTTPTTGVKYDFISNTGGNLAILAGNVERFRINSVGNIGIAQNSPTEKLDVVGTVKATAFSGPINGTLGATTPSTVAATTISSTTGANFATSSGNVGIGTAGPNSKLEVAGVTTNNDGIRLEGSASNLRLMIQNASGVTGERAFSLTNNSAVKGLLFQALDNSYNFVRNVAMFGHNGNVGIGTTSPAVKLDVLGSGSGAYYGTQTYGPVYYAKEDNTDNVGRGIFNFLRGSTLVGQIVTTNTTCAYNNVSDYRLKEITGPVVDSGKFIDGLKPKVGTWKSTGEKFVGFVAHEFAEVSPSSVTGEKDAVDADGNPIYQSMQASTPEVMANLIAELQSLRARVAELEAKV
jgi:hypothetical protein